MFVIKRIYEPASEADGYRVLIDRLWPRGVSKEDAALDLWLKDIAPSPELRIWFHEHGVAASFDEFAVRYTLELESNPAVKQLEALASEHQKVTLLYAAHDPEHNHANVLLTFLSK